MIESFNDLVREVDPDTQKETVSLALYYLESVAGKEEINRQDVLGVIEAAKVRVPRSNISSYLHRMKEEGEIVSRGDGNLALSIEAERELRETIDLDESEGKAREGRFIRYSDASEDFYESIIEDINESYEYGLDDATLILSRKLLENLVLDVLRLRYGLDSEKRELFYNTEKGRLRSFSNLLDNLKSNLDDFEYFSDRVDEDLIREIDRLKGRGDASAHSIEVDVSDELIEDYRERLNPVVDILFYTKDKIGQAERRQPQ